MTTKQYIKYSIWGAIFLLFLILFFNIVTCVKVGTYGVESEFGYVYEETLAPGVYLILPYHKVTLMPIQIKLFEKTTEAASKDIQQVHAVMNVNYYLNPSQVSKIYKQIGTIETVEKILLAPVTEETFKAVMARYTAMELIEKRHVVAIEIGESLKEKLISALTAKQMPDSIIISSVALPSFKFNPEFDKAVEEKQVAEQNSLKELQNKKIIETKASAEAEARKLTADGEAYYTKATAEAEAEAIKIKADALARNPKLIELEAVKKWDGQVPYFSGSGSIIPFLNVNK